MNNKARKRVLDACTIGLSAALIAVSAYIQIPFFIPITLQSFAILLVCGTFGWKIGLLSTLIYILIGVAGLPVFSGGQAGISVLFGVSGGFILGFIPMSILSGFACEMLVKKNSNSFALRFVSMLISNLVLYACGVVFYCLVYSPCGDASFLSTLALLVFPFLLPDIVKTALAAYLSKRLMFLKFN